MIDGANAWQRLWRVDIPIIMPAILVAILFRYIFAIRLFGEVWLLTRGGPARLTEVLGDLSLSRDLPVPEFRAGLRGGRLHAPAVARDRPPVPLPHGEGGPPRCVTSAS